MKESRQDKILTCVTRLIDDCKAQTEAIRKRWRENYDMFTDGTPVTNKEEWQVRFSVNKLANSIRVAQGRLVGILVNNPEWYELEPLSDDPRASAMSKVWQKFIDYYLRSARFKRHAGTFFLTSLINNGGLYVGWKQRLIQNPRYLIEQSRKAWNKEQKRLSSSVTNPQIDSPAQQDLMSSLEKALDEFAAQAFEGSERETPKEAPYVQVGCLDLIDVNAERKYWDPSVQYMEDSSWKAFEYDVTRDELIQAAKVGLFDSKKVKEIPEAGEVVKTSTYSMRYKKTIPSASINSQLVKLTVYQGPLVVDGRVYKERYFCIIANDTVILKEMEYPFWEPPGHHTAQIDAAVRQIPHRPTGAGIGDNAVQLQKVYDSNLMLLADQMRYGVTGINIINEQQLVDPTQLEEGIYPGMTLHVRNNPDEVFKRVQLSSNIENQNMPIQRELSEAIEQATGINSLAAGGANPLSRTSAAETNARLAAVGDNINLIALDLEQLFLIPFLEKVFARVLQFGVPEVQTNPELQALFTQEEHALLSDLTAEDRVGILSQWYNFKITGFSSTSDKEKAQMRDNELLQIINSGGPIASMINLPEFMKIYFKNRDIREPAKLLVEGTPIAIATRENELLMQNRFVMPSEQDDHEAHLQLHGPLMMNGGGTQALQQHIMMHQQAVMAMQQQQAGGPGGQGNPGETGEV